MGAVVKETQRAPTAGGIINDLCHHRTFFLEEQFVADTDLTCRFHQHIPQAQLRIQLTQQEDFNLGIGLFLCAIQTGGEYLRIVEDDGVTLVEIVDDATELDEFLGVVARFVFFEHLDGLTLAMHNHHAALVATINLFGRTIRVFKHLVGRFQCQQLVGQVKFEL